MPQLVAGRSAAALRASGERDGGDGASDTAARWRATSTRQRVRDVVATPGLLAGVLTEAVTPTRPARARSRE